MKKRRRDTRGKDTIIKRVYRKKFSLVRIAREIDVSPESVSLKLAKLGLRERLHRDRLTSKDRSEILRQYKTGVWSGFLAKKYNVRPRTITDVARRGGALIFGRGNRPREFSGREKNKIRRLWDAGKSQESIASALKTSQVKISRLARQLGWAQRRTAAVGANHGRWKGGRVMQGPYVGIHVPPDHRFASMRNHMGYILEHRLVMAEKLGRALRGDETVHHVDGDHTNNAPENLQIRHGHHGIGVSLRCAACGSMNIVPAELK